MVRVIKRFNTLSRAKKVMHHARLAGMKVSYKFKKGWHYVTLLARKR